jgi:hypothetical protein
MERRKETVCEKIQLFRYMLLIENHLLLAFGNKCEAEEADTQDFVFVKLKEGLSQKTIRVENLD